MAMASSRGLDRNCRTHPDSWDHCPEKHDGNHSFRHGLKNVMQFKTIGKPRPERGL
jgi:hypothetical protein